MKILKILLLSFVLTTFVSCREKSQEPSETETVITEEKSTTTETGQRIGATKDSTSVDGEPGTPSNY